MMYAQVRNIGDLFELVKDAQLTRSYKYENVLCNINKNGGYAALEFVGIPSRPKIVTCKNLHIKVHGGKINGQDVIVPIHAPDEAIISLWHFIVNNSEEKL